MESLDRLVELAERNRFACGFVVGVVLTLAAVIFFAS